MIRTSNKTKGEKKMVKVRVEGWGIVTVSEVSKKKMEKFKRGWGSESVYLRFSPDRKFVQVRTLYTSMAGVDMKVLKSDGRKFYTQRTKD
ncbi:MAG: hypothetical protein PHG66_06810, partial [Candidatus Colwellbacteria bacterium]|nr:hypothetical protein [Candidatus Colwellbacteria bacterium]